MLTTDDWVTLALFGAAIVAIVSLGIWAHRIRQAAGGGPDWFVRVVVGIGLGKALDGGGGDGGGGDGGGGDGGGGDGGGGDGGGGDGGGGDGGD